jgi:uncharacterized membrane protein HdeD (DUF308 family)
MLEKITRNWWMLGLRGVIAVIFGVVALIWPGQTVQVLVVLFGAFALVDGIFATAAGIASARFFNRWWALLLEGLTGIIIGFLTFFWPAITGLVLLYFIAAWAIITGAFEVAAAIEFRRVISGEWAMVLNGLLSIGLGIVLFVFPAAGAVGLVWAIGLYAIALGILLMILAFRLHSLQRDFLTAAK